MASIQADCEPNAPARRELMVRGYRKYAFCYRICAFLADDGDVSLIDGTAFQ